MKLRLKALFLALGLAVSSLSMGVYAQEETDATEEGSEAAESIISQAESGAETEDAAETDEMALVEVVTEANGQTEMEEVTEAESEVSMEDSYKELLTNYLSQISDWTDEEVEALMDSEDNVTALIALNWNTVKSELGEFEEVTEITDAEVTDSGYGGVVTGIAKYSDVGKSGTVYVSLTYEYVYSSTYGQYMMELEDIEWEVDYTLGSLMQKAALNTIMGICIVFLFLALLSFLISRIKFIPALLDRSKANKENEEQIEEGTAPAPEAAALAVAETGPEDDLEIVAVISAAVAAYRKEEGSSASGDSYVVRSIKKVNNKNWRKA